MLAIAGQTTEPNKLKVFEETHRCPGSNQGTLGVTKGSKIRYFLKNLNVFLSYKLDDFKISRAALGTFVSQIIIRK